MVGGLEESCEGKGGGRRSSEHTAPARDVQHTHIHQLHISLKLLTQLGLVLVKINLAMFCGTSCEIASYIGAIDLLQFRGTIAVHLEPKVLFQNHFT